MLPKEKESKDSIIPPQIKLYFTNFKTVSQSHYYQTFNAVSSVDSKACTIRVLDVNSEFYKHSPNAAATLFIQELLRLSELQPNAVLIQHFEIHENLIAFATTGYCPLDSLIKDIQNSKQLDYEQLIKDILADIHFLHTDLKFPGKIEVDLENIYQFSSKNRFFLGDWSRSLKIESGETKSTFGKNVSSFETDNINTFAHKVLEFIGVEKDDINDLIHIKNSKMYKSSVDIVVNELDLAESLKQTMKNMLSRDTELIQKILELVNAENEKATRYYHYLKNNPKNSNVRIKVGDLPQGNVKTSGKATINFGKKAEETQREKLKTMIEYEDVDLSFVFILRYTEGKSKELETVMHELLHIIFPEEPENPPFKTYVSDSKFIVYIKFPVGLRDLLKKKKYGSKEFPNLASKLQLRIDCDFASGIDFLNVLEYHQKNYSTPFAFICKPLMMELSFTPEEDLSQTYNKLLELDPKSILSKKIALILLKPLKTGNIDLSFNEIKDLTDPFKILFRDDPSLYLPRFEQKSPKILAESLLFGKMIEMIESDVEVYVNWKEICAIHMQIKAPGFGIVLNTPLPPQNIQEQEEEQEEEQKEEEQEEGGYKSPRFVDS